MVSLSIRIVMGIGILIYFLVLISMVKKNRMGLKYSLLWGALGVLFIILDLFPILLALGSHLLGIGTPVNALFAAFLFLLLMLLLVITGVVSRQSNRIRVLIQELALLEKRVRELEAKADKEKRDGEDINI